MRINILSITAFFRIRKIFQDDLMFMQMMMIFGMLIIPMLEVTARLV